MEGRVAFLISDIKKAKDDDALLNQLVEKELTEVANRHFIPVEIVIRLKDDILKEMKKEIKKMREGEDPYPSPHHNSLFVQMEMPQKGKVGIAHWGNRVVV